MKLFVSFDGDHIGRMVGRASLADNPEEVARIAQSIERGNRLWSSWAESHGGKVINVGGDEGRLEIEADYLSELPGIREQYEGAVGSTCSVGIGTKLSEADRSLMAAKVQGGDRIQLYTEEVEEILAKMKERSESEKLQDEYLDPDTGLNKAQPAMNAGSNAGFAGASHSQPAAPAAPTEGSEHSENEVLQSQIANAPAPAQAPKATAADFEQLFHQLAASQKEEPAGKPSGLVDGVREQVVKVLQQVKAHAAELEQMKQTNPEMYTSVVGVVQAMIAMARGAMGDDGQQPPQEQPKEEVKKSEELEKALPPASGSQDLQLEHLHPKHQKALLGAKTPKAMSDYIHANEASISNHVYGKGEDFLVCDQAASLLSSALKKKNIPHHSIVGYTRDTEHLSPEENEDRGQSHAWIRTADGEDLDPTDQGTVHGQVIESWPPMEKAEGKVGRCKWKLGERRCQRQVTGNYCHDHVDHWANKIKANQPPAPEGELDKAALEAGKTGRHQVNLPVGSQVDPGPSAAHEGGELKVQDPVTGKTKWRQVRSGIVMAPDGTPTSSRNPSGG